MEKMTITEALSEVKLIVNKIQKKRATVLGNLTRYEHIKDPFTTEGGSQEAIKREVQSMTDLEKRLVRIRTSISRANASTDITIGEKTQSVADWLTWKREIAPTLKAFVTQVHQSLKKQIDEHAARPQVIRDSEKNQVAIATLVVNVDYEDALNVAQKIEDMYETLDGKLSLKNATTFIEI